MTVAATDNTLHAKKAHQLTWIKCSNIIMDAIIDFTCSENVYARPCISWHPRLECDKIRKSAIYAMRIRRQVPMDSVSGSRSKNVSQKTVNDALETHFPKHLTFLKSVEPSSRNRYSNVSHRGNFYAVCSRPEIADYVISGEDAKTFQDRDVNLSC